MSGGKFVFVEEFLRDRLNHQWNASHIPKFPMWAFHWAYVAEVEFFRSFFNIRGKARGMLPPASTMARKGGSRQASAWMPSAETFWPSSSSRPRMACRNW